MYNKRLSLVIPIILTILLISAMFVSFKASEDHFRCKGCNVVVISVDTLRADHLGAYGYERNTSPNIDRLAEEGTLFENTYSHSSHTTPSHFSLFTGLHPRSHGVVPGATEERGFSEDFKMLAEIFNESGYQTFSYTGGSNVRGDLGFERGFDTYIDRYVRQSVNPKGNLDDRGKTIVKEQIRNSSEPFFMFLHTFKVHDPYYPPESYKSLFKGFNNSIREKANRELRTLQRNDSVETPDFRYRWSYAAPRMANSTEWRKHAIASYDADIRYTDEFVGEVKRTLEEEGIRDRTVIIFTSDHGEQFGEHGGWYHYQLYKEELHVPLIIDIPGTKGSREDEFTATVDIAPTILDIVGISDSEFDEQKQGVSLMDIMQGEKVRDERYIGASHYTNQTSLIDAKLRTKYYDNRRKGFERVYRFNGSMWEREKNKSLLQHMRLKNKDFAGSPDMDEFMGIAPYAQ